MSRCGIRLRSSNISPRRFPDARLWPEDRASRAHARSISAEMHSGFMALRNECGMNLHRPVGADTVGGRARRRRARSADLDRMPRALRQGRAVPVRRVQRRGRDVCAGGASFPHLCGRGRSRVRGIIMDAMMSLPAFQEWTRAGLAETLVIEQVRNGLKRVSAGAHPALGPEPRPPAAGFAS